MTTVIRCDHCAGDVTRLVRLEVEGAMSRVFGWDFCCYGCLASHLERPLTKPQSTNVEPGTLEPEAA